MDDIQLLIRALVKDKEETINVIKNFGIRVQGFQRNFDKAPQNLLITSIKNELIDGIKKRSKKGRKYATIDEVYEFIYSSVTSEHPQIEGLTIEELNIVVELEHYLSATAILSILYHNFNNIYSDKIEVIYQNVIDDRLILEGLVKQIPTEEKINHLIMELNKTYPTKLLLETYQDDLIKYYGSEVYEEWKRKACRDGEASVAQALALASEEEKMMPLTAFLLDKDRFEKSRYQDFLLYLTREFNNWHTNLLRKRHERTIKDRDRKANYLKQMLKVAENDRYQLENAKHEVEHLKINKEKTEILLTELERKNWELKQENLLKNPFVEYFYTLVNDNDILLITSEPSLFKGMPLDGHVLETEDFKRMRRNNDVVLFKGKVVFITRISFESTSSWLSVQNFLRNNGIIHCELSGYDIENYIGQMVKFIYQNEELIRYGDFYTSN